MSERRMVVVSRLSKESANSKCTREIKRLMKYHAYFFRFALNSRLEKLLALLQACNKIDLLTSYIQIHQTLLYAVALLADDL